MKGFLLATMEPSPALEEEFNDWYDTEHVPERVAIAGFESATRMVCVSGWPRYVALYDLRSVGVLNEPAYLQVSGKQHSPWSKRILRKVRGLWRATGDQVYPGESRFTGAPRMLMICYANVPAEREGRIVEAARTSFEGKPGLTQVRVMRCVGQRGFDYLALIEGPGPFAIGGCTALQGEVGRWVRLVNEYSIYRARGALDEGAPVFRAPSGANLDVSGRSCLDTTTGA